MNFKKNIVALFFNSFSQLSMAQVATDSIKTNQLQEVIVTGTRTERSVATLPLPTPLPADKPYSLSTKRNTILSTIVLSPE